MRGGERGRHARGYAEREGDEGMRVHGDGAEGGEGRAMELAFAFGHAWVRVRVRVGVGSGNGGVEEGGHERDGLCGVAEEGAKLVSDSKRAIREVSSAFPG